MRFFKLQRMKWVGLLSLMMVCGLVSSPVRAAVDAKALPFADRLPGDAMMYMGWVGSDHLPEAYQGSQFEMLAGHVQQLAKQVLPMLLQEMGVSEDDDVEMMLLLMKNSWKYRSALSFTADQQGNVALVYMSEMGKDAAGFVDFLKQGFYGGNEPPPHVLLMAKDGVVTMVGGAEDAAKAMIKRMKGNVGKTVADDQQLLETVGMYAVKRPAFVFFQNQQVASRLLIDVMKPPVDPGDPEFEMYNEMYQERKKMFDGLGYTNLRGMGVTAGLHGQRWDTRVFLDYPGERKGVFKGLEGEPLTDAQLNLVPGDVRFGTVSSFDWNVFYNEMVKLTQSARGMPNIERELQKAGRELGIQDVKHEVIDALGDHWGLWMHQDDEALRGSLELVQSVKHADRLRPHYERLIGILKQYHASLMQGGGMAPFTLTQSKWKGQTVTTVSAFFPMPLRMDVVLGDDYLRLKYQFNPEAGGGVKFGHDGQGIVKRDDVAGEMQRMGVKNPTRVVYMDLGTYLTSFQNTMKNPQMMELREMIPQGLPETLFKGEVYAGSWNDEKGWYYASSEPYPGARLLGLDMMGVSGLAGGLLVPQLQKVKEQSNRTVLSHYLKAVSISAHTYALEHDGKYPEHVAELISEGFMNSKQVLHPDHYERADTQPDRKNLPAMKKWVDENSDFEYFLAGRTSQSPAGDVVAYEKLRGRNVDTLQVLFGDGSVRRVSLGKLSAQLKKQGQTLK